MNTHEQYGLNLFQKQQGSDNSLRSMLQYLRTYYPGKGLQFSYIESESSLIPHLSLWENLQLVAGGNCWKDILSQISGEWLAQAKLIQNPETLAINASSWEKLTVSLLKAVFTNAQHILVDINENLHSPFNLSQFKKLLAHVAVERNVVVASANTSLWLDSSHSLISRDGYEFKVLELDQTRLKNSRSA